MFSPLLKSAVFLFIWSTTAACDQISTTESEKMDITTWAQHFSPFEQHLTLSKRFTQQTEAVDINADGVEDYIYYVEISRPIKPFSDITIVQPWIKTGEQTQGAKTAILIVHGGIKQATLIHDKNDLSVLDTSAMTQSQVIVKANIKYINDPYLTNSAKGDIILIPTEAGIDSYIYWNGQAYMLYEVIEIP